MIVAEADLMSGLRAYGMKPVQVVDTADGDHVQVNFDVIGNDTTPWHKAITCQKAIATPKAIALLWNDWANQKRKEIAIHIPSHTIQKAIQVYGIIAVMSALSPVRIA